MTNIKLMIFILLLSFLSNCKVQSKKENTKKTEIIINLKEIVDKNEKEVESVLGKSEKTEIVKGYPCKKEKCNRNYYQKNKYEIIFKKGKANRITIYNIPDLTNDDDALEKFGLINYHPTFKNPKNVIRWENRNNIAEISCFTDYILVQSTKE